jgi:hypothetical protein
MPDPKPAEQPAKPLPHIPEKIDNPPYVPPVTPGQEQPEAAPAPPPAPAPVPEPKHEPEPEKREPEHVTHPRPHETHTSRGPLHRK